MRRLRWAEYLIEGWALGMFMISACVFGTLLFHPASPVVAWLPDPPARRAIMGTLMGLTLLALSHSPWGRRSGAQMNPAFTLSFLRLGRIARTDAAGYVLAQFVGGATGVWVAALLVGAALAHPEVHYVVTKPSGPGAAVAFAGEFVISAAQMALVLVVASSRHARYTAACAATALALYITVESPLSGTSMNPARTVASALAARDWTSLWVYFAAPMAGMLLASAAFAALRGSRPMACGKLVHQRPCHFCDHVAGSAPRAG